MEKQGHVQFVIWLFFEILAFKKEEKQFVKTFEDFHVAYNEKI